MIITDEMFEDLDDLAWDDVVDTATGDWSIGSFLDLDVLKPGLLNGGRLKLSLVDGDYAGGAGGPDTLKRSLVDADGNFKRGLCDADGNLKPGLLR